MATKGVKLGAALSVFVVLLAYVYKRQTDQDLLKSHLQSVLSGLLRAEKQAVLEPDTRVAVGFGACRDVYVNGIEVLDNINASPPAEPAHVDDISNVEDLARMFAYFFRHGAAAERYTDNETLFHALVEAARDLPKNIVRLGGNAPVMAARFHMEGCSVLLGAKMSETLRKELDADIKVSGEDLAEDDIHFLMEYPAGAQWGQYTAPRANRFIVHNDQNNPFITSLEEFSEEMTLFSPTLLVVGGLQMLDNFPFRQGERKSRLSQVQDMLKQTPPETRIHFEMASYAEEECLKDVIENVVYHADSLGMNEQELPNLHSLLTNGSMTLISDAYPRVATTLDQMRAVYRFLRDQSSAAGGRRKLTRLHLHTLAFQAILTTKGSTWKNSMSAAAKASLTANRYTCGSSRIHTEKARILMDESFVTSRGEDGVRMPLNANRPVSCWQEEDFEICIAPVLVCTAVVYTAGGGDNISSAGLVLQI